MFEQHPVPQQISSYSFKLVGNMTLRQFFQVAGGAIVALIIYALPLHPIIKWPAIIVSAISGAAFAFVPIQGRPLEQWLFAFFRSVYSPTIFVWNKEASKFPYFKQDNMAPSTPVEQKIQAQKIQQEIDRSQGAQNTDPDFVKNLDKGEAEKLNKISNMMNGQVAQAKVQAQDDAYIPKGQMIGADTGDITIQVQDQNQEPSPAQGSTRGEQDIVVPTEKRVETEKKGFQVPQQDTQQRVQIQEKQMGQVFSANQEDTSAAQAKFSSDAAPPVTPTQANTLVGQVMDSTGKIIEGAILEVKDNQGRPVRALKTNKVGHFMVVTPLSDGEYTIYTEKEGYNISPVKINLSGKIVEPVAIKAN